MLSDPQGDGLSRSCLVRDRGRGSGRCMPGSIGVSADDGPVV